MLPLVHSRGKVRRLLAGGPEAERRAFYEREWDTARWRLMFSLFFSRFVMGRLGRDPSFFRYVEGAVADRIRARVGHALTELDPAENPYLQWILLGEHTTALPYALRPENFEAIRANLDALEWRRAPIEDFLEESEAQGIAGYNLSDIFEYMAEETYEGLLRKLVRAGGRGRGSSIGICWPRGGARSIWPICCGPVPRRRRPSSCRIRPSSIALSWSRRSYDEEVL